MAEMRGTVPSVSSGTSNKTKVASWTRVRNGRSWAKSPLYRQGSVDRFAAHFETAPCPGLHEGGYGKALCKYTL